LTHRYEESDVEDDVGDESEEEEEEEEEEDVGEEEGNDGMRHLHPQHTFPSDHGPPISYPRRRES
jgi:hypothetical protein